MRNLYPSVDSANLIDGLNLWRKSSMNTQHFSVDDCSEWQVVKYLCAVLPGIGVAVFAIDLVKEAVHLGDLSAFVIAS